ncbi:MAG: DUF1566 domain-containing protein [Desulfobacteraceae bacterium]|nr:DUF1566 domain-containing protein [Desulfobacteraceae bacterium]
MKKCIMGLAGLLIILFAVTADSAVYDDEAVWINPAWRYLITPDDLIPLDTSAAIREKSVRALATEICYSYEDVVLLLNDKFRNRVTGSDSDFLFSMEYNFIYDDVESILAQAEEDAIGSDDYLDFSIQGNSKTWSGYDGNVTVIYSVTYLVDNAKEQEVDVRVDEILGSIITIGMNDEEKEKTIHDWIVANVEYDLTYEAHSAWAALFLGHTVCQGYSLLTCKMLQKSNIPVRIVNSEPMNHAWNMVYLCGHWYHQDATWDDPVPDVPGRVIYTYFNLSDQEISGGDKPHYSWSADAPEAPIPYLEGVCDGDTILSVSPISRNVPKEAGTTTFSVSNTGTGTMNWTAAVTSGNNWFAITSVASGSNSGTITCAFDANTSTSSRAGMIQVTADGATGSPVDVTVIQAESPAVMLTELSISGPVSINENSTATYTAIASWSDGTTSTVTPSWSENSTYASINGSGVVTTTSVPSDQTLTITASYTAGGITKTAVTSIIVVDGGSGDTFSCPVTDTGQTRCYDDTEEILCPNPGENFYGQDASYTINPPSYTKLDASGNALPDNSTSWNMVKDNVTGLIWEVKQGKDDVANYANPYDADNTYTWYDPNSASNGGNAGTPGNGTDTEDFINAMNSVNYGGYNDWRLPTINELASLFIYIESETAINTLYFPNTQMTRYWSSTTFAGDNSNAWAAAFNYGFGENGGKGNFCFVRAVRGGNIQSVFVDNQDGTVTDTAVGLMWQQETAPGTYDWRQALACCETLILAGHTDWRLPTIKEQRVLVDWSQYSPAIDKDFFPDTQFSCYWSSLTIPGSSNGAWCMDFIDGNEYGGEKINTNHVRAVRGGQSGTLDALVILLPKQASTWAMGAIMPIRWDSAGLGTSVKISLSRQGGVDGSFTSIIETTPNDGSYDWTIEGAASVNCVIKIEQSDDSANWAGEGLFSIAEAFQRSKLADVIKGLQVLAGVDVDIDINDSLVDANQDGKVQMNDVLENMLKIQTHDVIKTYEVTAAGKIEFFDDISGAVIIFPDGGSGTLTVTRIANDPDVDPLEGNLFLIEFTGDDDFQISYPRSDDAEPLVWVYGTPQHPTDFSIEKDAQWMPLPPVDTTSMPAIFDLYNPGEPIVETARISFASTRLNNRPAHSYKVYYQNALKYNNDAWKRSALLWDITKKTIADIWAILPASVQARALSDYTSGLKPKGAYSGWSSSYNAFRYLAGLIRVRAPYFWYNVYGSENSADEAVVAHECGHYISHLIMGDDQFEKLQAQRTNPHDVADVHTNRDMLEEYAFFGDYFKNGDRIYKRWDIINATQFFKWKRAEKDHVKEKDVNPTTYNWPNLEGFGCFFLARLHTDKSVIVSHADINIEDEPVPVFGLDFTTIYGYLAKGPLTDNELYDYVENSFTSDQKAKLAVMVEKMGWSYNGFGKIVDTDGKEVVNAMVENISSYSGWEAYKNGGSEKTGTDGKFTINRIYPGTSKLRVYYNLSDDGHYLNYKDFDIDAPKEDATHVSRDFKTLVVDKIENNEFNFSSVKVMIHLTYPVFYYNELEYQGNELCMNANYNDVGWVNFPSEQAKRFQGAISGNIFTGTCADSAWGPGTGQISITLSSDRTRIESFNLTFSNGNSDMNNFTIVSANVSGGGGGNPIPRTYFISGYKAEFEVTGNTHNYLTNLNYVIKCKDYPEKIYELSYSKSTQNLLLIRFE